MARSRVVYVLSTPPDGRSPADVVAAWPDATRLLTALNATGRVDASALWRTDHADIELTVDGVVHRFVRDGRAGARSALALRRLRPHVVHANSFLYPVPLLAMRAALGRRVRLVVQHHGEQPTARGSGRAQTLRLAGRAIDGALFTGADEWGEVWRAAGVLGRRTTVHEVLEAASRLAPIERDEARHRTGVHGEPAVVWVGRLIEGKDPLGAVDAFAGAFADSSADGGGAHLWMLCTNRAMETQVRAHIDTHGLGARVHLVGPVPHAEVAAWLSAADVVLATSRREGSGYALIEAVTCGATPVVSDIGPHRAIAGALGERFPPGDADAAARALRRVRERVAPRPDVLADAGERLSWPAVAEQLLAAYGLGASTVQR